MHIASIRTIEDIKTHEALFSNLDYKIFGFILYHTGNKGIRSFFITKQNLLDKLSGKNTLLFLLERPNEDVSRRIEGLSTKGEKAYVKSSSGSISKDSKHLAFSTVLTHSPYDPDESFTIAQYLGLPNSTIPCVVFFRRLSPLFNDQGIKSFAVLKLNPKWFSKSVSEKSTSVKVLTDLFDRLDNLVRKPEFNGLKEKEVVKRLKLALRGLQRKHNIYKPFYDEVVGGLESVAQLPFSLVKGLDKIIVEYTKKKLLNSANQ